MIDSSTPADSLSSDMLDTAASAAKPASTLPSPSRTRRQSQDAANVGVETARKPVKSAAKLEKPEKLGKTATKPAKSKKLTTKVAAPDQTASTEFQDGVDVTALAQVKPDVVASAPTILVEAPAEPIIEHNVEATGEANSNPNPDEEPDDTERLIQEPRVWQDDGWTARVIKNEDDEGWAVAMTLDGEPEPALVGPWTMGRDKKNPKPMDANAFSVLVKTAYEVRRRHEQAMHAMLHKSVMVDYQGDRCKVSLQIVPDEYEPHAFLRAFDPLDDLLAEVRVEANFKLSNQSAAQWIANDFRRPGGY